jgi:hypothetical protein
MTMTPAKYLVLLAALGGRVVVEPQLPPGPGVHDSEVGMPGPWYGVEIDGRVIGYERSRIPINCIDAAVRELGEWDVIARLADRLYDEIWPSFDQIYSVWCETRGRTA